MRHHRLPLIAGVVATGLAFAVAGCDVSTSPATFNVTYRVNIANVVKTTGGQDSVIAGLPVVVKIATIDSVYYSPGTGKCTTTCSSDSSLVIVTNPATSTRGIYTVELTLPAGATVQATLVGHGTATGNAQFAVIWQTASGTIRGDSVTTPTTAGAVFTIPIAKFTL